MKRRLKEIEDHGKQITSQKNLKNDLTLIITSIEHFFHCIESNLESVDWNTKRDIIRALVKRIEINCEDINVVFRVNKIPGHFGGSGGGSADSWQHCPRSLYQTYQALPASILTLVGKNE